MADVFISYAREDKARADQVARGLQAMGLECFWDTEIPPGQTWADYIEGKLSACKAVVVLWSAHSTGSQWVREEARMGRDKGKLIPAMLDNSPAPFGFGEVQAANLAAWTGASNHPDWARFSNAVHAAVKGPGAAPRPAPLAAFTAAPSGAPVADGPNMSALDYVKKCLRMYVNGNGRARRAEYWWWALFVFGVSIVAYVIDVVLFGYNSFTSTPNVQAISTIVSLGLLCPGVCVAIRRFHDVGLSGWYLAGVVGAVFVGALLGMSPATAALGGLLILAAAAGLLIVALIPSRPGANAYGANPKGE